jgi:hypothetical protein
MSVGLAPEAPQRGAKRSGAALIRVQRKSWTPGLRCVTSRRSARGTPLYDSAAFTRSGENGTRRMRTPVASKMAFAIAAATGRIDGSPAPVGGSSG